MGKTIPESYVSELNMTLSCFNYLAHHFFVIDEC